MASSKRMSLISKQNYNGRHPPDKINQLRHVRYFKDINGMKEYMKKHAEIIRPKFEAVLETLEKELGELGIASWSKPVGGYFISFNAQKGCAKAIVAKCKEAGLVLTGAGAAYPYGNDRKILISESLLPYLLQKSYQSRQHYL